MYEIPDQTDVAEIVLDEKVINNGKAPKYIHTKKKAV